MQGVWKFTFDFFLILSFALFGDNVYWNRSSERPIMFVEHIFQPTEMHLGSMFFVLTCCQLLHLKEYCVFLFSKLLTVSFVDRSYLHALMPWYRLTIFWHANIGPHTKTHKWQMQKCNLFNNYEKQFRSNGSVSNIPTCFSVCICIKHVWSILSFLILYSTLLDICTM